MRPLTGDQPEMRGLASCLVEASGKEMVWMLFGGFAICRLKFHFAFITFTFHIWLHSPKMLIVLLAIVALCLVCDIDVVYLHCAYSVCLL